MPGTNDERCWPSPIPASPLPPRQPCSIRRPPRGPTTSCRARPRCNWAITPCMNGSAAPGMRCAEMQDGTRLRLDTFATLDDLPADTEPLLAAAPDLFVSREWWRTVLAYGMPAGTQPCFLVARNGAT